MRPAAAAASRARSDLPSVRFGPPARCELANFPHPSNRLRFQVTGRRRAAARDGAVRRCSSVHARLLIKWKRAPAKLQRAIIHLPPQITESAHVSLCRSIIEGWGRLLSLGVRAASRRARRCLSPSCNAPLLNSYTRSSPPLLSPQHTGTKPSLPVSRDSSAATLRLSECQKA